jgi:hypothetical protein
MSTNANGDYDGELDCPDGQGCNSSDSSDEAEVPSEQPVKKRQKLGDVEYEIMLVTGDLCVPSETGARYITQKHPSRVDASTPFVVGHRKKNPWWLTFSVLNDGQYCNICGKSVSTGRNGSPTTLRRHFFRQHRTIYMKLCPMFGDDGSEPASARNNAVKTNAAKAAVKNEHNVVGNPPCLHQSGTETTAATTAQAPIGSYAPVEHQVTVTYGTAEKGMVMRKWLDDHALPQSVGDVLAEVGARCVDDVRMVILECPELVSGLAPLDRVKLQKACVKH